MDYHQTANFVVEAEMVVTEAGNMAAAAALMEKASFFA
ncbi:hypothetical protein CCACVL1_28885 [Corchorus capsularis]|uniref:Uncharacterized protein n=1 Tax=Corchorus capsularis TaxID=210143 RepID=A0A1R3G4V4_COCAP|nr:hypothetical protein CCACVL1_28885 [Corchorus capsularis]